jgi:glutamyl-tRNA reductase
MLVSVGLDFRRARLDVRERFHLDDDGVRRVTAALHASGASETVLARTCNRVEVYSWWPDAASTPPVEAGRRICRAWAREDDGAIAALEASASMRSGGTAARHLFRVAAGLESQILGDIHILGQLRRAFRDAIDAGSIGSYLHRLFETGLRVGKQVKRETCLHSSRNSVGSEAAYRAAARSGRLAARSCVVVGCGKSGTHAARALTMLGAKDLVVVNRTIERAEKLARETGARAAGIDALPGLLARADIVIVATSAQEPVVRAAWLEDGRHRRHGGDPLLVIDVSVPRNVQTRVGALDGVELIDLDTLHPEAAEVERSRLEAIPKAEVVVERGLDEFVRWLDLEDARRALRPLHEALDEICLREVSHLAGPSASARRTADRIVARIMARPMAVLRAASERGEAIEGAADALRTLFAKLGLEGDLGLATRGSGNPSTRASSARTRSDGVPHHATLSSR